MRVPLKVFQGVGVNAGILDVFDVVHQSDRVPVLRNTVTFAVVFPQGRKVSRVLVEVHRIIREVGIEVGQDPLAGEFRIVCDVVGEYVGRCPAIECEG